MTVLPSDTAAQNCPYQDLRRRPLGNSPIEWPDVPGAHPKGDLRTSVKRGTADGLARAGPLGRPVMPGTLNLIQRLLLGPLPLEQHPASRARLADRLEGDRVAVQLVAVDALLPCHTRAGELAGRREPPLLRCFSSAASSRSSSLLLPLRGGLRRPGLDLPLDEASSVRPRPSTVLANPRLELERLTSPTDSLMRHCPAVPKTGAKLLGVTRVDVGQCSRRRTSEACRSPEASSSDSCPPPPPLGCLPVLEPPPSCLSAPPVVVGWVCAGRVRSVLVIRRPSHRRPRGRAQRPQDGGEQA